MKTFSILAIALLLGVGLGIVTATLRIVVTPSEGLPIVDPQLKSNPALSKSEPPAPLLSIDRLEYDFGSLDIENSGRHEFVVENRGNALLKITKGETTCRCTASDLERSELPPGESTKIVLTWRPTAEPGPYQQSATFYTNDPNKPKFTISITGKITALVRIRPTVLILSRISANETTQGSVTVLSYLEQPLEIKSHRFDENPTAKYFDLAITPLSAEGLKANLGAKSGYLLAVTVKPGLPQGAFQQRITLSINNPNKPELAIPVEGGVGKDISIVGPGWDSEHETLYLGTVKSQTGLNHRLLLIVLVPYRKEVQFKLVEKPPVPLKISLGETLEINNGQVTQTPLFIEIPKGNIQASHLGPSQENGESTPDDTAIIQLETTHPEIPKLRIPIRFAVER
jgi:hypothetical protein